MENVNFTQVIIEATDAYQNIINHISPEKCNEILERLYEECENVKDLSLETDREKSFIFYGHFLSYAMKMPYKYSEATQLFQNIDFDTICLDYAMDKDNISERIFGGNGDSIASIKEKPYYNLFLQMLSPEERNVWMSNKELSDMGNLLSIANNKNLVAKIIYFLSEVENNQPISEEQEQLFDNNIKLIKALRRIRTYKDEYKLVKSFCGSDMKIWEALYTLAVKDESLDRRYRELILVFHHYCLLYDDDFKDAIWVLFDELIIPLQRGRLWNFMLTIDENDPYIECFCLGLQDYYNNKGKTLPFDLSVLPFWRAPRKDIDENHDGWFLEISQDHYDGDGFRLVKNLEKLYNKLVERELIKKKYGGDTDKRLFIYRFSGYDCPIDESTKDSKLKWNGEITMLGYMVRCLYQNKFKQNPPFKMIEGKVFDLKNVNLATAKVNKKIISPNGVHPTLQRAVRMLEDCGFKNLYKFTDGMELE